MEKPTCDGVVLEYYDPVKACYETRIIHFDHDARLGYACLKMAIRALKSVGINLRCIYFLHGYALFSPSYGGPTNPAGKTALQRSLPEEIAQELLNYSPPS